MSDKTCKRSADETDVKDNYKKVKSFKTGSTNLSWYMRVYKGLNDWHLPIFQEVNKIILPKTVLYPGSDKHITASLVFFNVTYVDFNKKLVPFFKDEKVLQWIKENKFYTQDSHLKFFNQNFKKTFEVDESFDLIISACAGIVSKSCSRYLKIGGYFLVSDAHSDARAVYLMPEFEFIGVFNSSLQKLDTPVCRIVTPPIDRF